MDSRVPGGTSISRVRSSNALSLLAGARWTDAVGVLAGGAPRRAVMRSTGCCGRSGALSLLAGARWTDAVGVLAGGAPRRAAMRSTGCCGRSGVLELAGARWTDAVGIGVLALLAGMRCTMLDPRAGRGASGAGGALAAGTRFSQGEGAALKTGGSGANSAEGVKAGGG